MNDYFRHPFPSRKAFGPYASPGPVVHVPVMILLTGMSWLLSNATFPVTLPTVCVALCCSIYLGRDLAIQAHYNILITSTVLVLLIGGLSVRITLLKTIHLWARGSTWGWPGVVYVLVLLLIVGVQAKRHHNQCDSNLEKTLPN